MTKKHLAAALLALAATTVVCSPTVAAPPTPGRYYQMQAVSSGLRLEVAFASTGFAPIIQSQGAPSYRPSNWRFEPVSGGFYRIINRNGGNCIRGGAPSVRLVIYQGTCGIGTNNEHWSLVPIGDDFRITNRGTGLSLCIIGDLTFSAVPLVSDTGTSTCNKRFRLIPVT